MSGRVEDAAQAGVGPSTLRRSLALLAALILAACAATRPTPQADPRDWILIRDVAVVDVVSGTLRPHMNVTLSGARITAIADADHSTPPSAARVVDGSGRYLIPGLWDMHSHALWSAQAVQTFLPLYVANGVTGIRDMGGSLPILASVRESLRQDELPWPRVIAAGVVLDGPQPVHGEISMPVADAAGAKAAVETLAGAGVDFIKVYTLLPRDAYFAAAEAARRAGLPLAGHVPAEVSVAEAAQAGQVSIEHLRDEIEPLCSARDVAACAQLAELFRARGTWQVPTLAVLRSKAYFDDPERAADPRLRYVASDLRNEWSAARTARLGRGGDYLAEKRGRYADAAWTTAFLSTRRVPLLAGSDAGNPYCYAGFSLHDELELLVEAGLTPIDALRAATLAPAEFLAARDSMGAVEVGAVADLVLLRANPLENIGATRAIEAVVLRGRVFDRRQLDELLEVVAAEAAN